MDIASWKDQVEVVSSIVASGGIVFAGIGAYLKFFKGRVFHTRLALNVTHRWIEKDGTTYLALTPILQNTGISNVSLCTSEIGEHFLEVYECFAAPNFVQWEVCRWDRKQGLPVFYDENNLEAGETVSEEHLIIVANREQVSLKITLGVRARKNPWRAWLKQDQDYHYWKFEKLCSPLENVTIES